MNKILRKLRSLIFKYQALGYSKEYIINKITSLNIYKHNYISYDDISDYIEKYNYPSIKDNRLEIKIDKQGYIIKLKDALRLAKKYKKEVEDIKW